ncbi:Laccase-1 [Golovinomyces cichoracearum]|uniref:laccase n=1 Tax=Golovinomyces cichoracearum TaxID=62708 RepID=A0A420IGT6_9PEZI|nr:Laccase-1 [Golovinomyces cichoracearum]
MLTSFFFASIRSISWFFGAEATPIQPTPLGICSHDATDRACWGQFGLGTDYYEETPETGVIREYWFQIENKTMALDGVERVVLSVNGTVPGPTIIADWGDTVIVHVTNMLTDNGTSIHFHGVRQFRTNYMDGPSSITQCPIPPGDSFTYRWVASQYGSSWYHAHFSVQTWEGVFGGITINGPATANYDEDKGSLFLSDWSHRTASVLALEAQRTGPPRFDNGLINGTNVFNGTGSWFRTKFVAGTSYRLRITNSAADTHYRFTIDDHIMTVIATDFVAIEPYNTTNLSIGMGQRYDVVVYTNKETRGNFWMRAIAQISCSNHNNPDGVRGIIEYVSEPESDSSKNSDLNPPIEPNTTAYPTIDSCDDENIKTLVPRLSIPASPNISLFSAQEATLQQVSPERIAWAMNNSSFVSRWDYPTLEQFGEGNNSWARQQNLIRLPEKDRWVYFLISTNFNASHPIHFHGHDFWVLASGVGTYQENVTLQLENGPRRDVAMLPAFGYLVLAIVTDNPGAWLAHCHIAWHAAEGFALQLLEREDEIRSVEGVFDKEAIQNTCRNWRKFSQSVRIEQDDSGLR